MPGLRNRDRLQAPEKFESWAKGDSHAPSAIRTKNSKKKAQNKQDNKKYGDIKKGKKGDEEKKKEQKKLEEERGKQTSTKEAAKKKILKVKMKFSMKQVRVYNIRERLFCLFFLRTHGCAHSP